MKATNSRAVDATGSTDAANVQGAKRPKQMSRRSERLAADEASSRGILMTRTRALLVMLWLAAVSAPALAAMPQPVLHFFGAQQYWVGKQAWVRYELGVANRNDFDQSLFQPTPDIHHCYAGDIAGMVRVYDVGNPSQPIYEFCPRNRRQLASFRYALKKNSYYTGVVMIQILDQRTNQSVWSGPVSATTRPSTTGPLTRPPVSRN
jgi:hypothetical protein